jgi:arsenate reductase-like glutaredoxin family protein
MKQIKVAFAFVFLSFLTSLSRASVTFDPESDSEIIYAIKDGRREIIVTMKNWKDQPGKEGDLKSMMNQANSNKQEMLRNARLHTSEEITGQMEENRAKLDEATVVADEVLKRVLHVQEQVAQLGRTTEEYESSDAEGAEMLDLIEFRKNFEASLNEKKKKFSRLVQSITEMKEVTEEDQSSGRRQELAESVQELLQEIKEVQEMVL